MLKHYQKQPSTLFSSGVKWEECDCETSLSHLCWPFRVRSVSIHCQWIVQIRNTDFRLLTCLKSFKWQKTLLPIAVAKDLLSGSSFYILVDSKKRKSLPKMMSAVHRSQDWAWPKGTAQVHNTGEEEGMGRAAVEAMLGCNLGAPVCRQGRGKTYVRGRKWAVAQAIVCAVNKTMFYLLNLGCVLVFFTHQSWFFFSLF